MINCRIKRVGETVVKQPGQLFVFTLAENSAMAFSTATLVKCRLPSATLTMGNSTGSVAKENLFSNNPAPARPVLL
jgi:hypothetical protein